MPVTVYLILATVYCIFDIGQKGPMQFIGSLDELCYLSENMLLTMFTSALIREPFDLSFLKFPPMPPLLQFHITRKTVFEQINEGQVKEFPKNSIE